MKKRIYLSPPHMGELEEQYVKESFLTNWIAPLGPNVEAFEQEVADYVGVKGALALSSGTCAIHLALKLLGVSHGDSVFCSTLTFVASANPIIYQGAIPTFIDSEPDSWNMSPQALSRALNDAAKVGKLPKAIIIVHLYGQSADMDPLLKLCDQYEIPLIEDAAESLGASYKGKQSGTLGKYGIYSFNGNKIITTSGGGMLVSDDTNALEKARYWATQARDAAVYYEHSEVGYNYRLSNILAGVGRGQLHVLDKRISARRLIFNKYYNYLAKIEGIKFMPEAEFGQSTRWLTSFTIEKDKAGVSALELVAAMEHNNIESRPIWKPMHLQPLFRDCQYYSHSETESVSEELYLNGICIPSGSNLSENDQEQVIDCIGRCLKVGVNSGVG